MGQFNPNTYKPADDSSSGAVITGHARFGKIVLLRQDTKELCACGCNQAPSGKHSSFLMGHDARLKGILIRAHLTQTPVGYVRKSGSSYATEVKEAAECAARYEWEPYLEVAAERLDARVAKNAANKAARAGRVTAANSRNKRPSARKAKNAIQIGDVRKVKVGRWTHDAKIKSIAVKAGMAYVEYEVKGIRKTAEVKLANVGAPVAA